MYLHFNHSQIRRYIIAFGSLFTNIELRRVDGNGVEQQRFKVPIQYGPKEKWYTRLQQDPDFTRNVNLTLPRLSYEMTNISYDSGRKVNTLHRMHYHSDEATKINRMFVGVPYMLTFDVVVMTKLVQDGFQITEQILPYFTPDLTFALNVVPELGIIDQVPVTLVSVNSADNYEGDFEKRRFITWTFGFKMPVNFYGPRKKHSRIEEVMIDLYTAPFDASLVPPVLFEDEDDQGHFVNEDGEGAIHTEETDDVFLTHGRVSRITSTAIPTDQQPESKDDIEAVTTVTTYDGDVKRTRTTEDTTDFDDE